MGKMKISKPKPVKKAEPKAEPKRGVAHGDPGKCEG